MILIVCVDDRGGMMFGARRQSRDSVLSERLLSLTEGKSLFVSPYSAPLFNGKEELMIFPDPAKQAGAGEYLFIEDTPLPKEGIEEILLYRWNRSYPATRRFSPEPSALGFSLEESEDFKGSSHERITEERWKK